MTTVKNIIKLINSGESETLEFKANFSNEAIKTITAFSNTHGGIICIGVLNNGGIAGLNLNKESVQQWINEIKNKTIPSIIPDIEIVKIQRKVIALIHIKEYPVKPVSFKGRFYKRVENSNHLMRPDEVAQAHYKTFNSSWDYTIDPDHSISDISLTKVKKFINSVNRTKKEKIKDSPLQVLKKFDLLRGKCVSKACFLLFTKKESLFTAVELGRFQTETLIKDGVRTKADLFNQVDAILDFISKHINKEYIITGSPQREERWDYPLNALREIVTNLVVHRDYSGSTSAVIKIFDDKIQFSNSGRLPSGLTISMLLRGEYISTPRNIQIADMFKEAGIIEKYGSGISRIVNEFKAYGLVAPEFREVGENFSVTVFKTRLSNVTQKNHPKKVTEKVT
ncbi:MAG: putative DNA binding domain-containing protein, partial [Elusimicrobiales bacterium]|nr:putative DNA binding domain-containing protein [Elusimicrobiales bacterium]